MGMGPGVMGTPPASVSTERKDEEEKSHSPKTAEVDGADERTDGDAPHGAAKDPPQTPDDVPVRMSPSP